MRFTSKSQPGDGRLAAWTSPALSPYAETPRPPLYDIVVWDIAARRTHRTISTQPRVVSALAMTPDGSLLATTQPPSALVVYDPRTGLEVAVIQSPVRPYSRIAISSDGKRIACTSGDPQGPDGISVWDAAEGKEAARMELPNRVLWIQLSRAGEYVAAACADTTVQLWRTADRKHLVTFRGHRMPVASLAFSPTGERLVSADQGGAILLWDIGHWTGAKDKGSGR